MGKLVILEEDKLPLLAEVVYYQEVNAIQSIQFGSEPERAQYLQDCRANYENVLRLLNEGAAASAEHEGDEAKQPIAHDVFGYVKMCVNSALQTIRNYSLRSDYLKKISDHSAQIITALTELDSTNVTNVRKLAREAAAYKNSMVQYLEKYQSRLSTPFSDVVKDQGMKFNDLIAKYQSELGFAGRFEDLYDEAKLRVYEKIIEESGRGKIVRDRIFGGVGIAVFIFTAGCMVWDIFSSSHKIKTSVRDAASDAASEGGAALGKIVSAAVSTGLMESGIETSAIFISMIGFVTGMVASFILGAAAASLCDLILSSGGSAPISTEGFIFYVAPMPDGATLARQLAHDDPAVLSLIAETRASSL